MSRLEVDKLNLEETHFEVPRGPIQGVSDVNKSHDILDLAHGTTTMAFVFNEGVVVTVDSRSTMGTYIASQTVKKVVEINDYLLGTIAGGAADCAFWQRVLSMECRLHELRNKKRISVSAASKLFSNILYQYKGYGLSVGSMMAGWDVSGPALFYIDSEGNRMQGQRFAVGSGYSYAYSIMDALYRPDLCVDEACELGRRSVYHATHRDAYSGGVINVYLITPDGWRKISADDCKDLHDRYESEKTLLERPLSE